MEQSHHNPKVTPADMRAALDRCTIPIEAARGAFEEFARVTSLEKASHDPAAHHGPRTVPSSVVNARRAANKRARAARRAHRRAAR